MHYAVKNVNGFIEVCDHPEARTDCPIQERSKASRFRRGASITNLAWQMFKVESCWDCQV